MTVEAIIVLGILAAAVVLFVGDKVRVDIVALGVMLALMASRVLTPREALAGFSNTAVITIVALFVIGGAVLKTGLAEWMGRCVLRYAGRSERILPLALMLTSAVMSCFMSNTGTVAVLLPVVVMLARSARVAPSLLLLPMAFGSSFGGAMTLIGTPPNIIVSDALRGSGREVFSFFAFTPMGVVLLALGLGFMWLAGRRLLPARVEERGEPPMPDAKELIDSYHLVDGMARLRVRRGSPLIGRTIGEVKLRREHGIDVLVIRRPFAPRPEPSLFGRAGAKPADGLQTVLPAADTELRLDDLLLVTGEREHVAAAAVRFTLATQAVEPGDEEALVGKEVGVVEVVVRRDSKLVGKTLAEADLDELRAVNVLGVHRPNQGRFDDAGTVTLRFGDVLITHGAWENLAALKKRPHDYILLGQPEAMVAPPETRRAGWAAGLLVLMVVAMVAEWMPLVQTALLAAMAMVAAGCIGMNAAYRSIDWKSVVVIAGMIPLSTALVKVGLVDVVANRLVDTLGQAGPLAMLAGLFVLTAVFTQFLSNTATVVVVAPIALTAAEGLGVRPQAFLMGIAVAGSMAFASPVASPVNTLVMAAGNYRFIDYVKLGVPLIALSLVASLVLLPQLFPF